MLYRAWILSVGVGMVASAASCATTTRTRLPLDELSAAVSDHKYLEPESKILAAAARVMQEHGWEGTGLRKDNFSNTYWAHGKKDCEAGDKDCGGQRLGISLVPAGDGTRASFVYDSDAPMTEASVMQIMKMTVELLAEIDPVKAKQVLEDVRSTASVDRR